MRQLLARMMLGGCFLSTCRPVYLSLHFQERQAERGGKKDDAVTDKLCVLFVFFSTFILSLSLTYDIEHRNQREGDGKTKTRTLPAIRRALLPVSRYMRTSIKKEKRMSGLTDL